MKSVSKADNIMMKMRPLKSNSGFTLIELMVAVAIVGILAQMALPAFTRMKILAARSEVKVNFGSIYALQKSYHAENGVYGNLDSYGLTDFGTPDCSEPPGDRNTIGFRATNTCQLRYNYGTETGDDYNNVTEPAGGPDVLFSIVARAQLSVFSSSTTHLGRGLGINPEDCNYLGSLVGYNDWLVMNQDKEFGNFNSGNPSFYDVTLQCG